MCELSHMTGDTIIYTTHSTAFFECALIAHRNQNYTYLFDKISAVLDYSALIFYSLRIMRIQVPSKERFDHKQINYPHPYHSYGLTTVWNVCVVVNFYLR